MHQFLEWFNSLSQEELIFIVIVLIILTAIVGAIEPIDAEPPDDDDPFDFFAW